MRTASCLAVFLLLAVPAAAQDPDGLAEGPALGLFVRPAVDAGTPWLINGFRVSFPVARRLSLDLESATVFGAETEHSRVHAHFGAQVRLIRPSDADNRSARYWIAGVQLLPGDDLAPDGSIRDRRLFANAVAGIGARQLFRGATRVVTEASIAAGSGLIGSVTLGVQWGPHRARRNRP